MDADIGWLLKSDPWTEYRTRIDILGEAEDAETVLDARNDLVAHPRINTLISELEAWPGEAFASHKSAGLLIHKLSFIAETGLKAEIPQLKRITEKILAYTEEGIPQSKSCVSPKYGGSGKDVMGWALCDAPLILFSLFKLGAAGVEAKTGLLRLKELCRDNGWPCAVSSQLGTFRGPGRKEDPCPYATLLMLKALAAAEDKECPEARAGAITLLDLWERSRIAHPYIFYMGDDFRKLKAPFIWYDILHVADVLSRFEWLAGDARLNEIADIIQSKFTGGSLIPESVWTAWRDFDFGQKKAPSAWLTFLALRILKRLKRI